MAARTPALIDYSSWHSVALLRVRLRLRPPAGAARCLGWLFLLSFTLALPAACRSTASEPPLAPLDAPISISADRARQWQEGQYTAWLLSGQVRLQQDDVVARCEDAVLWIDRGEPANGAPSTVIAYLETDFRLDIARSGARVADQRWLGRFYTTAGIDMRVSRSEPQVTSPPPLVDRGRAARAWQRSEDVRPAQFIPEGGAQFSGPPPGRPAAGSITVTPRSSIRSQMQNFPSADPNESIVAITAGVRITVSGIENVPGIESGMLTLEADSVIIWTDAALNLSGQSISQSGTTGRWEFYLEGNIVFREGDRVIYADRMYFDATRRLGVILNAEALTPVPDYEGLMRLKADVLHQLDPQTFLAYGAAMTSSRLGVPRYWFQAGSIEFRDMQQPLVDPFTGQVAVDPQTGEAAVEHQFLASSRNNFLYVAGLPVLYWPVMATDLKDPTFYVDRIRLGNDSVFGTQAMIDWNLYQLLGWDNPPPGSDWTLSTDYLSERGPALGTNFSYEGDTLFALPGPYRGWMDAWGVDDHGLDDLGADRRGVPPERDERGRILWQHRQRLPGGFQVTGELGIISDRNFLEQYYEAEWDELKDATTGIELKRYVANSSWSITSDVRLNDFFTQTQWLPRLDHVLLGQSLLWDRLTWHGHSHVGYAQLLTAEAPQNSADLAKFDPLAWEAEREGIYAGTRHELDLPLEVGPVKVVPYVLGELFRVGEDVSGVQRTRAFGQAGVRSSLPFWRAEAGVRSPLLNLDGLAHKVVLNADFFWADADENLEDFPLYEPLDDDAVEFFRRRLYFDTFGGVPGGDVPLPWDERYFALRTGMQRWVTAPSAAIADDLALLQLGVHQRWQTRRGLPGQQRIIDWVVLDIEGSLFPRPERDNFGQELGLLNYDFRWHVGDRLTLLSDGFADFFGDGLRTFTIGGKITRPERGNLYLGVRSIEGPISSSILAGSVSYRMSEKWILAGGASVDLGVTGNIGQSLALTRIGESALVRIGFHADRSRGNVGATLSIEPRFLRSSRFGRVAGVQIGPAGAYGLE